MIAQLEALPYPWVDRATLQQLLGVGRRRAQQILQPVVTHQVGANGAPIELNDEGQPYTSRESEVTSLRQLARQKFESPSNFLEQYFPTRIVRDVVAAGGGDRSGDLENLRYDGPSMRPILLIQAGDSDDNSAADGGPPITGEAPNDKRFSREATLPGYNHLDILTAARRQNDGRSEPSSTALTDFALLVTR